VIRTHVTERRQHSLGSLTQFARLFGVQPAYHDFQGRRRPASPGAILQAAQLLGAQVETADDVPEAVRARLVELSNRVVEPVIIGSPSTRTRFEIRLPEPRTSRRTSCVLRLEDGTERRWWVDLGDHRARTEELDGRRFLTAEVLLPRPLPLGYHEIAVECAASVEKALLISAPARAWSEPARRWGVFLPLYALHTAASWGSGDFSDLQQLRHWVSTLGGDMVGILPVLPLYQDAPFDPSPYAPVSRLFWHEFYVDPRRSPELATCRSAQRMLASTEFQTAISALRKDPLVDYQTLGVLRRRVLEALARSLAHRDSSRSEQFREYVATHPYLRDYAAFRAVSEKRRRRWPEWPEPLRGGAIAASDYDPDALLYHQYAQWLSEQQVGSGSDARTTPGLCLDLPLGVHAAGYDPWRFRDTFVARAAAGAPPDALFTQGQNWQIPPLHPESIRKQGYRYVIDCLRHQLSHASMLRLDHAMGLHRLYWIPEGRSTHDGVYVRYHSEELYAILSLESHRHRAAIVGENLGIVPRHVNRALRRHGVHTMSVVQYEARAHATRPLRRVAATSVATLNTHDMPPFAGYLRGRDLDDRAQRGLSNGGTIARERAVRRQVRRALADFFRARRQARGVVDEGALVADALMWLAESPAALVLVNMEDLWDETEPQNLPGTGTEHPNWRRKARRSLEQLQDDPRVHGLLRAIGACRAAHRRRSDDRSPARFETSRGS
jgi:4-alpha-glucanotransferase